MGDTRARTRCAELTGAVAAAGTATTVAAAAVATAACIWIGRWIRLETGKTKGITTQVVRRATSPTAAVAATAVAAAAIAAATVAAASGR